MECRVCSQEMGPGEGIICYLCGLPFHFSARKACGVALPNPAAC